MAVFAVVALGPPAMPVGYDALEMAVRHHYGTRSFQVAAGHWLVADSTSTAQAISEKLGITSGAVGTAIVYNVSSYFGRAQPTVWEWLKANFGV